MEPCFDTYCPCDWNKLLILLCLSFLICKVGIVVLIGSLQGLQELIYVKCLGQSLVYSQELINLSN